MKSPASIVVELGHNDDAHSTIARRIELYRAIAATTGNEEVAKHFFKCADDLAAAEEKIGQLVLNFKS